MCQSNANEQSLLFDIICIGLNTCEICHLNWGYFSLKLFPCGSIQLSREHSVKFSTSVKKSPAMARLLNNAQNIIQKRNRPYWLLQYVPISDHLSFPRVSFLCLTVAHENSHGYGCTLNKESYSLRNDTWSEMGKHCNTSKMVYSVLKPGLINILPGLWQICLQCSII